MRARNIKPGFYKNADLAECSPWARLIFPGLWMLADREGRLIDRPKQIKGELLPYDTQDVEPLLRELEARGFIVRYEIAGERFIQICRFDSHQMPHYSEKPSVIKPPPNEEQKHDKAAHEPEIPGNRRPSRGGRNPLNPDCGILTPDSGFLTPDSLTPDSGEKPQRAARAVVVQSADLEADGLPTDLAAEWLAHRRRKRAVLTPAAWAGIKAEAARAAMSPAEAVRKALARGWTGFEADWLARDGPKRKSNEEKVAEAQRMVFGE